MVALYITHIFGLCPLNEAIESSLILSNNIIYQLLVTAVLVA